MSDWNEATLCLRYRDGVLTPGGVGRDEPETLEELVQFLALLGNNVFGGRIELELMDSSQDSLLFAVQEAKRLLVEMQGLIADDRPPWELKYQTVFCDRGSVRIRALLPGFSPYDPDTSYEEDVRSYVSQLEQYLEMST